MKHFPSALYHYEQWRKAWRPEGGQSPLETYRDRHPEFAAVLDKHYKDERIPKPMRIPCKMEYAEETLPNPYTNANEHVTHSWCMFFVDDDWRTMDYLHAVLDCAGLEPACEVSPTELDTTLCDSILLCYPKDDMVIHQEVSELGSHMTFVVSKTTDNPDDDLPF
jgi:hypothetical protein